MASDTARLEILLAKVSELERRDAVKSHKIADLERRMAERPAVAPAAPPLSEADVDAALRSLGERLNGTQPTGHYFNVRFRQYEWAVRNVKQLGYELALLLAEKNGLGREVPAPPATDLKSKVCTQADCDSDWFAFWMREMAGRAYYHRKLWEFTYIAQALWQHGKLKPGLRGLGFGCGTEPLPSLFAKHGAMIVATDLDPERPEARGWADTKQHAARVEALRRTSICPDPARLDNISLRFVDMNDIPVDFNGGFDFCWSACALEHLGSIEKGLAFIEHSLGTLRPGGVAVHTTEYNLEQQGGTIDDWSTVLYQRRHLEAFVSRLTAKGYRVAPLDLDPGDGVMDKFVDIPPFEGAYYAEPLNWAHLRLCGDGFACTSVGLIVAKP